MTTNIDIEMMKRALALADQARVTSPPNPWVGCVIINQGKIVGEGFTQPPGGAHAEVMALQKAKGQTKDATVYVTLEPCCHFGRTPPCVNTLIASGVSQVVIGIEDPDQNVQGKGISLLKEAGIEVLVGVLEKEISESLAPYIHHRKTDLSYCVLKVTTSIDGRIAAEDGTSQWISSEEARADCHQIRAESQAILVGAGTACVDLPALTVRDVKQQPPTPPLRVVLDGKGRVQAKGSLFDTSVAPTLILTSENCPPSIIDSWKKCGVEVEIIRAAENGLGVDLIDVLTTLGKRGILQVMVEGGGKVIGSFLEARIINQLSVYIGGRILGNRGIPLFSMDSIKTLRESPQLILVGTKTFGNTVRLDYILSENFQLNMVP